MKQHIASTISASVPVRTPSESATHHAHTLCGGAIRFAVLALCAVWFFACAKSEPRLSNTLESPEAVVERVLLAIEHNDVGGLYALCLNEYEHDSVVVPAIGKGQTDRSIGWLFLEKNIEEGIGLALTSYGGHKLKLIKVEFTEPDEVYPTLTLHRGTHVTVLDPATQDTFYMPLFGTMVEEKGHFKMVSIRET
jgi:hypothetical protein